ncbi:hypothetical protein [Phenylobacterium sp.]|uniref:hypothetical protein n=1 Tax=Phenylobacterium sp. TaxID=1871053 RepID=UPI00286BCDF8|nr:hypothetical protein [Phenylobacterium sp.]
MTDIARALLAEMLEAHGGDRWRAAEGVSCTILTGGALWPLKGAPIPPVPRRAESRFGRQWTRVSPFGEPDWTMTWTPQAVEVTTAAGKVVAGRLDGRAHFDRSQDGRWDPLNLAYFNGYAMWTYLATPFVFADPGYEVSQAPPVEWDGELLRGVEILFPEHIHSHSRRQRYYVGADGLVRRHDYAVDVWADNTAAHLVSDYVAIDGLQFPTRRRVYPRRPDGTVDLSFNTVSIDLSGYDLF